ncbi:unnamed protein product [Heligmosomoides polygyrus]|uniref:Uncharacterized protein n=1 Tax=Heligmosomoides polygyrus TaxID=6339 RepID=A0A3P8E9M1_HELPZ|nr:unnamed protein product [Heligmosomoides polygyrus]
MWNTRRKPLGAKRSKLDGSDRRSRSGSVLGRRRSRGVRARIPRENAGVHGNDEESATGQPFGKGAGSRRQGEGTRGPRQGAGRNTIPSQSDRVCQSPRGRVWREASEGCKGMLTDGNLWLYLLHCVLSFVCSMYCVFEMNGLSTCMPTCTSSTIIFLHICVTTTT